MMNKKRNSDYTALKRKLFSRVIVLAVVAVAVVLLLRSLSSGKCANAIVGWISASIHVDEVTAGRIYFFGIRNYLEVTLAICCIVLFLVFFHVFLSTYTNYLDEIVSVIEALTHDTGTAIQLSPELGTVESRLKTLQQTVERKESLAKQSEQRKNDLVVYSAHDIKTPLTSVLGYLILLNGNPDLPTEERKKYIGIALDKTRELDSLINELFEITRYNLNEIELEKTWINLYDMLSEIKEEQYPQLKAAQKHAEIEMNEDIRLYGDPDKLARVFNNLFRNAVLYSDANTIIKISASTTGEQVDIAFENTCAPISEAKLNRLFEQFYRGKEYQSDTPGSGLGLAIAKEIILLHGGSIRAESTETGIRFLVTLPVIKRESMKKN